MTKIEIVGEPSSRPYHAVNIPWCFFCRPDKNFFIRAAASERPSWSTTRLNLLFFKFVRVSIMNCVRELNHVLERIGEDT